MTCDEFRRRLSPFLDSDCSPEVAQDMFRHSEQCAPCAQRLAAEEKVEHGLRELLQRKRPGDDAAWEQAMRAIPPARETPAPQDSTATVRERSSAAGPRPRSGRRVLAVAAGVLVLVTAWFIAAPWVADRGHHELDLAAALWQDHAKSLSGDARLQVVTADLAEASSFLRSTSAFDVEAEGAWPASARLRGARQCALSGAPIASWLVDWEGKTPVTIVALSRDDLIRFPDIARRFTEAGTNEVHCTVEGCSFFVRGGPDRLVAGVGRISPEEIERLVAAFEPR